MFSPPPKDRHGFDLVAGVAEQIGAASIDRQYDPPTSAPARSGLRRAPHLVPVVITSSTWW